MSDWLVERLACPRDALPLRTELGELICGLGHRYPVVSGIPVLLNPDHPGTQPHIFERTFARARDRIPADPHPERGLHPFVRASLVATCGNLYERYAGDAYPIPDVRLEPGRDQVLLDVGCNWGRWSIAAAKRGYRVIGVDPNLEALLVAQMVAQREGASPQFVAGDARALPLLDHTIDVCFSYSVLQHFEVDDAREAIEEMGRVLRHGGLAFVQMANRWGLRSLLVQARRGFRRASDFEVRYWSPSDLVDAFEHAIGATDIEIDGFFGLGVQPGDAPALAPTARMVIHASELMRTVARALPPMRTVADSLYLRAIAR